ncbi:carboxymuconolactone decarboxylase family protein [Pseudomonas sp. BGr12]|uniref:carboxymuconolactone decarboxylase family protein n=1 Tax=unclassified Pseudomonas TaxID=196821 RepID=UPI00177D42A5|nr:MULTISPECIES: carboxymuconolactone decarboxylase family protein [unclassified Pseudomonas]MBD9503273.1 carboxymuconolactone decarboxylase family protein [Pseudomonas sp. PDM17]MBD9574254.1 carboxymuconolactone decarboxylase family protein [Pseudomonas sp. PDM23]MBD9672092.1 carboxymuconolactone decarboxylase family protein [Pseudomonas sp. PDM21]MDL2425713.1 carboxymuconolactone decarboxylase family protein [Pseudomonas sp. BJa5]
MKIDSRLTPLSDANMDDDQRRVLQEILSGPRGNLDGPFLAWVHSPGLADNAQKLGAFCRYGTRLELRLSELAILVTAAWWQSQAEWQIHEPIARQAGLSDEVIEALRQNRTPDFQREDERLIHRLGRSLYETRRIDQTLYEEATASFGEAGLVELVGIFGYYALVAMTLNAFSVRRETEAPLPFSEP